MVKPKRKLKSCHLKTYQVEVKIPKILKLPKIEESNEEVQAEINPINRGELIIDSIP
jgi:hypothetical protein